MGCRSYYDDDDTPEALAKAAAAHAEQEAERRRCSALQNAAEAVWVRFLKDGLAGITQAEMDAQRERIKRKAEISKERDVARQREIVLNKESVDLTLSCVHLEADGTSAFQGGFMYDVCRVCGDAR